MVRNAITMTYLIQDGDKEGNVGWRNGTRRFYSAACIVKLFFRHEGACVLGKNGYERTYIDLFLSST